MRRRNKCFNVFFFLFLIAPTGCAAAPFGSKSIGSKFARIERTSRILQSEISGSIANDHERAGGTISEKNDNDSPTFVFVALIAASNVLINSMREDDGIPFAWRFPRLMWEVYIFATTILVRSVNSPILYIFLAIILGITGLVDIFFWAPWFGLVAEFEDCNGGFFSKRICAPHPDLWVKGYGRLMVSAQSLFGGIFYLAAALQAWYEFIKFRDRQDIAKQYLVLDAFQNRDRQNQEENYRQLLF